MKKYIADAPAGLPAQAPDPAAPALTCDPAAIAERLATDIAALEKDAAALPPLLGFALNSLRGGLNSIKGHLAAAKVALLLFALLLGLGTAHAQIFYGGVMVTNSASAPIQVGFVQVTNNAASSLQARTLQVQNINTNQTIVAYYGYVLPGQTNLFLVNSNVFTFPASGGWTNGATFTTNISSVFNVVPVLPYGQINVGSYSNLVLFQ